MNLITSLQKQKNTFEDFKKWLFLKLNKDVNKFKQFSQYPTTYQLINLIQYLEHKKVNILEILLYYNYKSSNQALNFFQLLEYSIIEEFKRIENKQIIDYTPF